MAGMRRSTRLFFKQLAVNLVGMFITLAVLYRFGWLGVLALIPISTATVAIWFAIKRKWERRGAIK